MYTKEFRNRVHSAAVIRALMESSLIDREVAPEWIQFAEELRQELFCEIAKNFTPEDTQGLKQCFEHDFQKVQHCFPAQAVHF